jgi:hypothetical protein
MLLVSTGFSDLNLICFFAENLTPTHIALVTVIKTRETSSSYYRVLSYYIILVLYCTVCTFGTMYRYMYSTAVGRR